MKIVSLVIGWLLQKGSKLFIIGVFFTIVFAFGNYAFDHLVDFFNLVQDFINYIFGVNVSNDPNIQKFWGLLNCIGFVEGVNNVITFLFPALVLYFTIVAYHIVIKFYGKISDFLLKVI